MQTQTGGLTVGYALHADPTRPFWAVVGRGSQQAAADHGGEVILHGGSFDPQEQAQLIEDLVAVGVDGIVVSLANPDAMQDAVGRIVASYEKGTVTTAELIDGMTGSSDLSRLRAEVAAIASDPARPAEGADA